MQHFSLTGTTKTPSRPLQVERVLFVGGSAMEVLADSVEEVQDVEGEVGAGGGETLAGPGEVVRKGVEPAGEVSPISRGGGFGEGQAHSRAGGSTRKGALEGKGCVHGFCLLSEIEEEVEGGVDGGGCPDSSACGQGGGQDCRGCQDPGRHGGSGACGGGVLATVFAAFLAARARIRSVSMV